MRKDAESRPSSTETVPPFAIHIKSKPDSNPSSEIDGLPATQKQIDYQITINNERIVFPNVWALQVVRKDNGGKEEIESLFDPKVGEAMTQAIFTHQHPREAFIENVMSGRTKPPK